MKRAAKNLFSEYEDNLISETVNNIGLNQACRYLEGVLGRNRRIIKERYLNVLDPSLNPEFTEEDDKKLLRLVNQLGRKWKAISIILGDKSQSMVKGRYNVITHKIKQGIIKKNGNRPKTYSERGYAPRRSRGQTPIEVNPIIQIADEINGFMERLYEPSEMPENFMDLSF